MASELRVPTTGNAGEPAVVLKWNVQVGASVEAGEVLVSLETAKAVVEIEAPAAGTVLDIRFAEGDEAPEHEILALIGAPGEYVAAAGPRRRVRATPGADGDARAAVARGREGKGLAAGTSPRRGTGSGRYFSDGQRPARARRDR